MLKYFYRTVFEFIAYTYYNGKISCEDFCCNNILMDNNLSNEILSNKIISFIKENEIENYFLSDYFNIIEMLDKKMCELSGGQQKKILIFREIFTDSDMLFFDEPTAVLDQRNILDLKKIIQNIKKNKIVLIITHDNCFNDIADKKINLGDYSSYKEVVLK